MLLLFRASKHHPALTLPRTAPRPITTSCPPPARACQQHPASKRQTMRTYANFKKYERMRLTVIAKTSRCYHRRSIRYDTGRTQYQQTTMGTSDSDGSVKPAITRIAGFFVSSSPCSQQRHRRWQYSIDAGFFFHRCVP